MEINVLSTISLKDNDLTCTTNIRGLISLILRLINND